MEDRWTPRKGLRTQREDLSMKKKIRGYTHTRQSFNIRERGEQNIVELQDQQTATHVQVEERGPPQKSVSKGRKFINRMCFCKVKRQIPSLGWKCSKDFIHQLRSNKRLTR